MAIWIPVDRTELLPGLGLYRQFDTQKKTTSDIWQYEFHTSVNGKKKRIRKTTKKISLSAAMKVAKDAYLKNHVDTELGIDGSYLFEHFAKDYLEEVQKQYKSGEISNPKWVRHSRAMENYLIKFFGGKVLGEITSNDIEEYLSWRMKDMRTLSTKEKLEARIEHQLKYMQEEGGLTFLQANWSPEVKRTRKRLEELDNIRPANATLNAELTVLRAFFQRAYRLGHTKNIPETKNLSVSKIYQKSRPAFSEDEMKTLLRVANKWRKAGRQSAKRKGEIDAVSRYYRNLFFCFLRISFWTGLRTTEALVLSFNDVELAEDVNGNPVTHIHVRAEIEGAGKTGPRLVVATPSLYRFVQRMKKQTNGNWLFPVHGKQMPIRSIKKSWASLMLYSGMAKDKNGDRRVPYSTRHTYINMMLQKQGMNTYLLAQNCGNSVGVIEKNYGKGMATERTNSKWLVQ